MGGYRPTGLNQVSLEGRLTRDPDLKFLPSGQAVCTLSIAQNKQYTTAAGDKKERVLFIEVKAWGKQGELCAEWHKKGQPIQIIGSLAMDEWADRQTGEIRKKIYINASWVAACEYHGSEAKSQPPRDKKETNSAEDDVPF